MFTLSSNNESLIETEKKKTPKFPVCLQCNSLCPLLIDYTIPTKITFKCPCGNEEKTLLSEYIDKINNNFKPIALCNSSDILMERQEKEKIEEFKQIINKLVNDISY